MGKITEAAGKSATFREVYQIETTDPVKGGAPTFNGSDDAIDGINNAPNKQLADRTKFLLNRYAARVPWRNVILKAKMTAAGAPDWGAISGSGSSVVLTIDASSSSPDTDLLLTFAAGFDEYGPVDFFHLQDADLTADLDAHFSGLATGNYYQVYAELDESTGTVSIVITGQTLGNGRVPINLSLPSIGAGTLDTYMYIPGSGKLYYDDGASWVEKRAVLLGWIEYDSTGPSYTWYHCELEQHEEHGLSTPSGIIVDYQGTIPRGWHDCDGSAISRQTYYKLFNAVGTTYGVGDGSTTFNVPNSANQIIKL